MSASHTRAVRTGRVIALAGLATVLSSTPAAGADQVTTVGAGDTTTVTHTVDAPAAGDTHTFDNAGTVRGVTAAAANSLLLTGTGDGRVIINNDGRMQGRIDFGALQGGVVFNNNTGIDNPDHGWYFQINSDALRVNFSAGDDVLNNGANGLIGNQSFGSVASRVDFGSGDDAFNNAGRLSVGRGRANGNLTLSNLETFNNSGEIILGGPLADVPGSITNRLIMPGTHFVGLEGSRIALDVSLDGFLTQESCPVSGARQADCINLAGGATSGQTLVTVYGTLAARGGSHSAGVTLIDVGGGTSHAGDFVLDPASPGYSDVEPFGGAIRGPDIFNYSLLYHESSQTHRLVGIPNRDVLSLGILPAAAQSLWRTADRAASARQSELRGASTDAAGGLWFKATDGQSERDSQAMLSAFGRSDTVAFDYEQRDRAFTFGGDVTGRDDGGGFAFGVSVGEVDSKVEFDSLENRIELSGLAINVYGSYRKGWFFLDVNGGGYSGDVEGTFVSGEHSVPLKGSVNVFGLRTEAGSHLQLAPNLSLQPLLSMIYVRSGLSDIKELPGASVNGVLFDSGTSLRGGAGLRATLDLALASTKLGLSLSGRYWEEFEGEVGATVRNQGDPMQFSNNFDGGFGEVEATADLTAAEGRFSGYLSLGSQFGDDFKGTAASVGVRYNW